MASCATRVSAACASRGHVRALTSRRGRPPRVECPARRSRRGGLAATAPGPDAAADADEAAAALVAWATADGLRLSPKVAVGAPSPGAPRGLVATRDIAPGETVLTLPASCTAFDAAAARADETLGLGAGIAAYESAPASTRGADVPRRPRWRSSSRSRDATRAARPSARTSTRSPRRFPARLCSWTTRLSSAPCRRCR